MGIENYISTEMNDHLNRPFTKEDIFDALKSMALLKASREDGLEVVFYQRFWHVLSGEVA